MRFSSVHLLAIICLFVLCTGVILGQKVPTSERIKNIDPSTIGITEVDSLYLAIKQFIRAYPDSAMVLANAMITVSTQNNYEVGIAKGKETIARASMIQSTDSASFKLAFEALDYAKQVKADSIVLDAINILGFGNYRNKQIDKTYGFNVMGRRYAEEFGNWEKKYLFTTNAASIMADLNDFEKAVFYYQKSLELLKENPDNFLNTQLNLEIANIYYSKSDYDLAENFLNEAKQTLRPDTNAFWVVKALLLECNIALQREKLEKATTLLNEVSLEIGKRKFPVHQVDYRLSRAKIAVLQGDYEMAKEEISIALPIAQRVNYQDGRLNLLKIKFGVEQKEGNYESANATLNSFYALKDSIKYGENQYKVKIAEAESNFEREQELLQLQLEQSNTKQKTIFTIASIIVLFLLSILFLIRTNQKKLQQLNGELEKSKSELELKTVRLNEANTMKDKLFSIIGHDFKGPIAGIKNLIDMVMGENITKAEFTSFLPQVKQKVDHVLFSLNNLLAWGIGQLSGNIINPEKLELHSKITNAVNLLSTSISDKNIQIKNTVNPEIEVWADTNHIEIVIRNLLSNAIKFTPENGTISFGSEDLNDYSKFWIKDTGVGMPKNIQTKIFKQKQSVTTFGTNKEKGTGLGLSLCIDMIQLNHGKIWVESEEGKGTTIYFKLPKNTAQMILK